MKKTFVLIFAASSSLLFAKPANKTLVGIGLDPIENPVTIDKNGLHQDTDNQFGGAYLWGDIIQGNNYVTAAGKIYYRLNSVAKDEEEQQKIDIKRAYIKVRPAGNDIFEIAAGKLYSYYLPGGYFALAEIYTGNSRWGKSGVGTKFDYKGFGGGLALPVTETYTSFKTSFSLAAALSYNFKTLSENLPLELGFSAFQDFIKEDFSFAASALYSPNWTGFVSKAKFFAAYSYNAAPYVANSTFKNVSNYNQTELQKCHLASINVSFNLGKVEITEEAEAGHSKEGDYIPLYSGTQALIPIIEHLAFKPRFYYYAAINEKDSGLSRQTFALYPRLWLTFGKCTVSAGSIITCMQCGTDKKDKSLSDWYWGYEVPLYATWKF
ncbi:hypothetical protein MSI_16950 [Treponema sp. JC4]|uniref:hypothetical protein n=1 Tax=Treponema sp. JC4 TaxID=1124982 RepID=UPI00025AFD73|nr:hypothetical protein [Treponema sp. JC4]EID84828.1 hypothetical protein MSI_16950 [Treponema sp. JC4]